MHEETLRVAETRRQGKGLTHTDCAQPSRRTAPHTRLLQQ